jgi:hypothetical protein
MSAPHVGPLLGEAACLWTDGADRLVAALLRIDAAGLEARAEVGQVVDAVLDMSMAFTELADDYAHAEVERRSAV